MRRTKYSKTQSPPANPLCEACRSPALWLLIVFAIGGVLLRGRGSARSTASNRGLASEVASNHTVKAPVDQLRRAPNDFVVSRQLTGSSTASLAEGAPSSVQPASASAETLETILAVCETTARTNPLAAIDAAAGLAPSPSRDQALAHAVSEWADTQPEQAAEWAAQVPDPALRNELLAAVAVASAEEHPEFAGELAVTNLTAGPVQNNALVSVVQRWAQSAPEAAADWVSEFPEGPVRSAAAENLFEIWTAQDRSRAERYVGQLPQGWLREAGQLALGQLVSPTAGVSEGISQQVLE